jgi:[protein-PII] uridylyltransferase
VVADDQPGLLAFITAALSHAKVKVRSAQVYSWIGQDGRSRSLDMFWLLGPEDVDRAERLFARLEREIVRAIVEPSAPDALERHALSGHRAAPRLDLRVTTEVNIDNKSASNYTVIEVITRDRPALLFVLSHALQQVGLSIWFAKINTEGERVIDVFYVSDRDRGRLVAPGEIARVRQALIDAVDRLGAHTVAAVARSLPAAPAS